MEGSELGGGSIPEDEEEEEELLDPENPEHEYPIIERDFNRVVVDIERIPEAAIFSEPYTNLYDAVGRFHERQVNLEKDKNILQEKLQEVESKLETALKIANSDKETIDLLKLELQKAFKLTDDSHFREQNAQEVIDNLRKQVDTLNAELAHKNRLQDFEELELQSSKKDELEKQRDKFAFEVNQLQVKLTNALSYQNELEKKNSDADFKIHEINTKLDDQRVEIEQQKRFNESLEREIETLQNRLEEKDFKLNDLNNNIGDNLKEINRLEGEIRDQKVLHEKTSRELEVMVLKQAKLVEDNQNVELELDETKNKFQTKLGEMKTCMQELSRNKADVIKLSKTKDFLEKKINQLTQDRDDIFEDRNKLRVRLMSFEKEIEHYKKSSDQEKRALETLSKERDTLNKALLKQQNMAFEQENLIKIQSQSKKKLENELDNLSAESNNLQKTIADLQIERDRLNVEQLNLKKKIEEHIEEIRFEKLAVVNLKKTLYDQENKLRHQQHLFEAIRGDRNTLQKSLQDSLVEASELKNKLKIVSHQTEQLKEDVSTKEKLLVKEENVMRKVIKEKENLKIEVDSGLEQIKSLKAEIKELKDEEKRLHISLLDNDRIIRDQNNDLQQFLNERDVMGSQLVRRNDEIALLNEKIKILEVTLSRGETQYDQRVSDIRLLKIEVKRLRQEKNIWNRTSNNMMDLRQEILRLERDLTKYRLKCRALEEEAQNPLNIHRWRKLEGSDPEVLELIQKVQLLQKRLLQQGTEGIERERQLAEAEKQYTNLKKVLSKQPGPHVMEELNKAQRALKMKSNKIKVLVAELNMTELRALEHETKFKEVSEELGDLKRKFLDSKKAHRNGVPKVLPSATAQPPQEPPVSVSSAPYKFTGGGFRMSLPSK